MVIVKAAVLLRKTGPHSVDGMTGPVDLASWEDVMAEEKCSANGSEIGGKG
jgi:hypothetical protein